MTIDLKKIWNKIKKWPWLFIVLTAICFAITCWAFYWSISLYWYGKYTVVLDGPPIDSENFIRVAKEIALYGCGMTVAGILNLINVITSFKEIKEKK